ncbi:VCBS repeat domain-containing M23 family metallopeptidase [Amycolatopsis solani]|uniref:VCBS repeat domain-containing M23 family metallopeptidase n=1 Tax=Amycolatopsis solani TaxID=3028615 RepID=UPI0025B179D8|nr:VCBS repeat domain-containing M23 family metallopeptidase [Amycolatopsis sp. MEP2-6]
MFLRRVLLVLGGIATGLTVLSGPQAQAAPSFQLPFECGQQWRLDTWGHNPALDMVREPNQTGTEGAAVLAPASGTVNQSFYHDNAGNVIQINHGGGHFTTYLHLQSRQVSAGTQVRQGQLIGRVGATGPTSNGHPHLHYEQGFDSNGNGSVTWGFAGAERVPASFNGVTYTGSSATWRNVASRNCRDRERVSDFSGDGYADVLGVNAAGELVYYPNNGLAVSDSTAQRIGQGWGTFRHVTAADFSGDGYADVLGVNAAGELVYYPNNGLALSPAVRLATGWGAFLQVTAGDFSGDGYADVLAVNAAGELVYYPNNGLAVSDSTAQRLDTGWGTFRHVMAADFSGDGYADVLGVNAAGDLLYYPNNGLTISRSTSRQIGTGWQPFKHVFASDFSGDGYADVLGVNADGDLLYYPNNNIALSSYGRLDTGWGAFTHAM